MRLIYEHRWAEKGWFTRTGLIWLLLSHVCIHEYIPVCRLADQQDYRENDLCFFLQLLNDIYYLQCKFPKTKNQVYSEWFIESGNVSLLFDVIFQKQENQMCSESFILINMKWSLCIFLRIDSINMSFGYDKLLESVSKYDRLYVISAKIC